MLSACQDSKAAEDSVDMSERQPMFLKDKADAMHRAGNFKAAVNAYAQAVQIDASMTVCYSNRAASYLKLKEFRQATWTVHTQSPSVKYHVLCETKILLVRWSRELKLACMLLCIVVGPQHSRTQIQIISMMHCFCVLANMLRLPMLP